MRSTLIAGCFLAYGIGCIVINIVTFYISSAQWLIFTASVLVIVTVLPSFVSYYESPFWLVGKGRFTETIEVLGGIKKMNKGVPFSESESELIEMTILNSTDLEFDVKVIKCIHSGNWSELQFLLEKTGKTSSSGNRPLEIVQEVYPESDTGTTQLLP